ISAGNVDGALTELDIAIDDHISLDDDLSSTNELQTLDVASLDGSVGTIGSVSGSGTAAMTLTLNTGVGNIIPVNSGDLNVNLNADMVDNIHATEFATEAELADDDPGTAPVDWDGLVDVPTGIANGDDYSDGVSVSGTSSKTITITRTGSLSDLTTTFVDEVDDDDPTVGNEGLNSYDWNESTNILTLTDANFGDFEIDLSSLDESGGVTPTGAAGGQLDGTYPDPQINTSVAGAGLVGGGGAALDVNTGTGLAITSDEVHLDNSGVSAGTYNHATITVDDYGRITSATDGASSLHWEEVTEAGDTYLRPNASGSVQIWTSGSKEGKIDALFVDPVFQIEDKKYATWMSEGIGMRIDVVGQAQLNQHGEYKIDLAAQPEGSDLWLFYQTVADGTIVPFVTPQNKANLMARVDGSVLYVELIDGVKDAKFGYRLTGKRRDQAAIPEQEINRRKDEAKSFIDLNDYDRLGNQK
ncbi:MAG: hypothetical protein ACLFSQ_07580, partial [Candidatus Zixiibacteriota bacterium]